jgi:hypothetical protein
MDVILSSHGVDNGGGLCSSSQGVEIADDLCCSAPTDTGVTAEGFGPPKDPGPDAEGAFGFLDAGGNFFKDVGPDCGAGGRGGGALFC